MSILPGNRSKSFVPSIAPSVRKIGGIMPPISQSREDFELGLEDYELIRVLGKGSYGIVRLAKRKSDNTKVAIKTYEKATPQVIRNARNEINVLKYLDHPSVLKLIEVRQDANSLHLVMEYAVGSSLESFVKTRHNDSMESARIFKQILSAVHYCHKMGVVHRDLKLANIIIDSRKRVKVVDFGFATFLGDSSLRLFCGTPEFMAPELMAQKPYSGQKVDMWALGVILYVLLTKAYPFVGRNEREILRKISLSGLSNLNKVPNEATGLLKSLLSIEPAQRITAYEALKDPWLGMTKYTSFTIHEKHFEH